MSAPLSHLSSSCLRPPPNSPLFPYTTLFRSFHTLWPDGPARTRISCEWLFHRDSLSRPELDPEDGVRFWDTTNRQDWHICEQSQAGVSSRAYVPGPYSPRESVPAAWDREFLRAIGHAP